MYVCERQNGVVAVGTAVTGVPSPQFTVAECVSSVPASVNDVETATAVPVVPVRFGPALTTGFRVGHRDGPSTSCASAPLSSVTVNVNVTVASSRPVNVGACTDALLNVAPADTVHAYETIVPSESVDVAPDTTIEEPSTTVTGPVITATGAAFGGTVTTVVSQPTPPSSSVTQTVTVKLPATV